ncbi:MAG: LysM peptidoglycan-binding domain-containing protein [Bacteroidales bacterium]|nr:LysM peptidoglycan-binding domain-containing protein [Bacteroidales bacterium]
MKHLQRIIIFSAIILSFSSTVANAQLFQRGKYQDSVQALKSRLDSLQAAYDELYRVTVQGEPIDMTDDDDDFSVDEPAVEEAHNTDSLLSVWYVEHDMSGADFELPNVDDIVLVSNIPDSVFIDRLNKMNSFIKIPYNPVIRNYIVQYTEKMPARIGNIIGLSRYWMPQFEDIFMEYDLPQELKALAVVESALNTRAVSRAKAKGMWQFISTTARHYNLEMTSYVDERFDPIKSCRAAAQYLRDAYDIFGDWSLAIASYNCGSGNVNKAIRRSGGGKDFWDVYNYLPRETRGYVPAFVAALYVLNYYPEHNIVPTPIALPAHVDTFMINRNLHFGQISENIGVSMEELRDLNPQYLYDIIPADSHEYLLRIPYNYTIAFVDKEKDMYGYKDSVYFDTVKMKQIQNGTVASVGDGSYTTYKVKSGDTLGGIARRYGTTVNNLKSWNNLHSNTIRVGQRLRIYGKGAAPSTSTASSSSSSTSSASSSSSSSSSQAAVATTTSGGYVTYTVKKGDTLWAISNKFDGVTLHDIMTLNGFTNSTKIYPGMKIKIKPQ